MESLHEVFFKHCQTPKLLIVLDAEDFNVHSDVTTRAAVILAVFLSQKLSSKLY